jgi:glucokinase
MKLWAVGVDVGGTKIAVSLAQVSSQNKPRLLQLDKKILSSKGGNEPSESITHIQLAIKELTRKKKINPRAIRGVGLAVAGAIDSTKGIILKSPNLKRWERYPFATSLSRKLRLPVHIENDANAAALGEACFGLGRGVDHFLYVTVSTGIGSGLIVNGALVRGAIGSAGELGHMTMVRNGVQCKCGKKGCLEAYSSGTAIATFAKRALRTGIKSRYFKSIKPGKITGQVVGFAAQRGDRLAIQARREAADYLGVGLANVINLLNPERIILGGGVLENVIHFWTPMMKAIRREAWPSSFKSCMVVRSKLGTKVGDYGAVAVALSAKDGRI